MMKALRCVPRSLVMMLGVSALVGSCSDTEIPQTQLLVRVEAGPKVTSSVKYVRAYLYPLEETDESKWVHDLQWHVEPGSRVQFPFSFGIAKGQAERFKLVIKAYASSDASAAPLIEQKAITGFVTDHKLDITLSLLDACHQNPCSGLAVTCSADARAETSRCGAVPTLGLMGGTPTGPSTDGPPTTNTTPMMPESDAKDAGPQTRDGGTATMLPTPPADAGATKLPSAAERLQGLCDAGDLGACTDLGVLYDDGDGVPKDPMHAVQLYTRACEGNFARGCANLGLSYYYGEGVAQNRARAIELFNQACNGGSGRGCTNLGYQYGNGIVVTQDYPRARELYERACNLGEAVGCYNAGTLYLYGRGGPVDLQRAAQFLRLGCSGGEADACALLDRNGLGR